MRSGPVRMGAIGVTAVFRASETEAKAGAAVVDSSFAFFASLSFTS